MARFPERRGLLLMLLCGGLHAQSAHTTSQQDNASRRGVASGSLPRIEGSRGGEAPGQTKKPRALLPGPCVVWWRRILRMDANALCQCSRCCQYTHGFVYSQAGCISFCLRRFAIIVLPSLMSSSRPCFDVPNSRAMRGGLDLMT